MRADAVLAPDIDPTGLPTAGAGPLLLTGATGFLGAHLLQALQRSGSAVVCLVRAADDAEARARVQSTLRAYQLDPIAPQVRVVAAADKIDNLRAIASDLGRIGEQAWARFKRGRKDQEWYYRGVAAAVRENGEAPAIFELLDREVTRVFGPKSIDSSS